MELFLSIFKVSIKYGPLFIGSKSAISVVDKLGFTNIKRLNHGQTIFIDNLSIEATKGAPVPSIENGYILNHSNGSLYVEPHGFLDESIRSKSLDAVITPVVEISLPLAGKFKKGRTVIPKLIDK